MRKHDMQLKRHLRASDRWLKMDNGDWARACLDPLVENESGEITLVGLVVTRMPDVRVK